MSVPSATNYVLMNHMLQPRSLLWAWAFTLFSFPFSLLVYLILVAFNSVRTNIRIFGVAQRSCIACPLHPLPPQLHVTMPPFPFCFSSSEVPCCLLQQSWYTSCSLWPECSFFYMVNSYSTLTFLWKCSNSCALSPNLTAPCTGYNTNNSFNFTLFAITFPA